MNVGKLRVMRQDYKGAIDSLREAVFLAGKLNGQDLLVAETTYSLAAAYYQSGHPERAEPLVKAAIAKYESIAGPDSPALGGAIMLQADVALSNRRLGVAEKQLNRAIQLLTTAFGPEDVEVAIAESKLGELCLGTNRPVEAERLLRHAISDTEKRVPASRIRDWPRRWATWRSFSRHRVRTSKPRSITRGRSTVLRRRPTRASPI